MKGIISLLSVVFALTLSSFAFAGHCPKDAKAITHALESSKVEMSTAKEVKALRDKGMELHKSGKHRESEKALAEAMRTL